MKTHHPSRISLLLLAAILLMAFGTAHAQKVQVNNATPAEAEQESTGLEITIDGNGFDQGSKAFFYLSGTENPAGITVTNSRYVNSKKLVATIDVDPGATIGEFDIVVQTFRG